MQLVQNSLELVSDADKELRALLGYPLAETLASEAGQAQVGALDPPWNPPLSPQTGMGVQGMLGGAGMWVLNRCGVRELGHEGLSAHVLLVNNLAVTAACACLAALRLGCARCTPSHSSWSMVGWWVGAWWGPPVLCCAREQGGGR